MKAYPRLFQKLFASPLMLHAPARMSFENVLLSRMFGETPIAAVPVALVDAPAEPKDPDTWRVSSIYERTGSVAVITIDGVIDKRVDAFELSCYGGVDLADVDAALAHAANDPRVTKIVLDIHSPGGSVIGVHDTYQRILDLAQTKEVHAYVNAMACSAGYYIASAADFIAASPSAIVGSIGVYMAVLDASRWYQDQGLQVQVMQGGIWKTMGAEWKPLSDPERAKLQAGVEQCYTAFKAAVNAKRPQVADSTMQGQWMNGTEGLALGLVDETTGATLDEYVSALLVA
ncbi:S49 family peptidase [Prosthecobacter sp.]|uniref:S49 family peptidase n=1 Tax=Prosthecobacter sp. TaxID=1965333 RepID=UPI003784CE91